MHLGRFHATIYDLAEHFRKANLLAKFDRCAALLDQYGQSQSDPVFTEFREALGELMSAGDIKDPDLLQPYAQQIIKELRIDRAFNPKLSSAIRKLIDEKHFHYPGLAVELRNLGKKLESMAARVVQIDEAFGELDVEFECVRGEEAEVGILLPREIVGETLPDLVSEFSIFSRLARAINEITGAVAYDPRLRTISSSWWQFFLELGPEQIAAWTFAIERIVALHKSSLEIQKLKQDLQSKQMPDDIIAAVDAQIAVGIKAGIREIATEIRAHHAKIEDEGRLNELENQLQMGLKHLAKRVTQGAEVETNVALSQPDEPPLDVNDVAVAAQIQEKREHFEARRALRDRANAASVSTEKIMTVEMLSLGHFEGDEPPAGQT